MRTKTLARFAITVFTSVTLGTASAQTYISAEPIPSQDIVGEANLNKILALGYPRLELWSRRLLKECRFVDNVIQTLSTYGATRTLDPAYIRAVVAAGGFQAVTDPTFVVTIGLGRSGRSEASANDVFTLNNALGYVLNQSGTAQFALRTFERDQKPFQFPLDYAIVTYAGTLSGVGAQAFFDYLGTIDSALWSGENAGFTQINASDDPVNNFLMNNSMLFLIGSVPTDQFIRGLSQAARTTPNMTYTPVDILTGRPTTGTAAVAFPGNDWRAFPNGDEYLAQIPSVTPALPQALQKLRQQHLTAVAGLLNAIAAGNVDQYLASGFRCPI